MYKKAIKFWSRHVFLANSAHATGGFGLALILQKYFSGNSFLPVIIGWVLLAYALLMHVIAFMSKK